MFQVATSPARTVLHNVGSAVLIVDRRIDLHCTQKKSSLLIFRSSVVHLTVSRRNEFDERTFVAPGVQHVAGTCDCERHQW